MFEVAHVSNALSGDGDDSLRNPENWVSAQEADPDLRQLRAKILRREEFSEMDHRSASSDLQAYIRLFDSLFINGRNILSLKRILKSDEGHLRPKNVALVPAAFQDRVMLATHRSGAHLAVDNTLRRAQESFFWPQMRKSAEKVVQACEECVKKIKQPPQPQRHTLESHQPGYPFFRCSVDIVGPFPPSAKGHRYILTVRDEFSRWPEAYPLKSMTAEEVVDKLTMEFIPRYGAPGEFQSDRGSQFTSQILQTVARMLRIRWRVSTPFHAATQGCERLHRDLVKSLRAFVGHNPREWHRHLPAVLLALRTTVSKSTGMTPAAIVYGKELRMPLEVMFGTPNDEPIDQPVTEYSEDLKNRLRTAYDFVRRNIGEAIARQRLNYFKDKVTYRPDDQVWLFSPRTAPGPRKLAVFWTGPWRVVKAVNPLTFVIRPHESWNRQKQELVSIDRLRPYVTADGEQPANIAPADDQDLSFAGDEFAEVTKHLQDQPDVPSSDDEDEAVNATPHAPSQGERQATSPSTATQPASSLPSEQADGPPPSSSPSFASASAPSTRPPPKPRMTATQRLQAEARSFVGGELSTRTRSSSRSGHRN